MRDRLLSRFDELVNDVLRSSAVWVAHTEVDDVLAAAAGGDLHLAGNVEDIGRQALNTTELFHKDQFTVCSLYVRVIVANQAGAPLSSWNRVRTRSALILTTFHPLPGSKAALRSSWRTGCGPVLGPSSLKHSM